MAAFRIIELCAMACHDIHPVTRGRKDWLHEWMNKRASVSLSLGEMCLLHSFLFIHFKIDMCRCYHVKHKRVKVTQSAFNKSAVQCNSVFWQIHKINESDSFFSLSPACLLAVFSKNVEKSERKGKDKFFAYLVDALFWFFFTTNSVLQYSRDVVICFNLT